MKKAKEKILRDKKILSWKLKWLKSWFDSEEESLKEVEKILSMKISPYV